MPSTVIAGRSEYLRQSQSTLMSSVTMLMYRVPLTNLHLLRARIPLYAQPFNRYVVRMFTALSSAQTMHSGASAPISMRNWRQASSERSAAAFESCERWVLRVVTLKHRNKPFCCYTQVSSESDRQSPMIHQCHACHLVVPEFHRGTCLVNAPIEQSYTVSCVEVSK
jgi:hypothetical protein